MNHSFEVDQEGFSGKYEIAMPRASQRLDYYSRCGIGVDSKSGEFKFDENDISIIGKLSDICTEHIVSIKLKHLESGTVANSWEEVDTEAAFMSAIVPIGLKILVGTKLGEASSEASNNKPIGTIKASKKQTKPRR